jgi:hypothetical protein
MQQRQRLRLPSKRLQAAYISHYIIVVVHHYTLHGLFRACARFFCFVLFCLNTKYNAQETLFVVARRQHAALI